MWNVLAVVAAAAGCGLVSQACGLHLITGICPDPNYRLPDKGAN